MTRSWRAVLLGVLAVGVALTLVPAAGAKSSSLERGVLDAVRSAGFGEVVDFGPVELACPGAAFCASPAPRVAYTPNVDVAVIELGRRGRAQRAANVLLSRDYPNGLAVPVDEQLGTSAVRFRRWDIDRWNGGTFASDGKQTSTKGWKDNPPLSAADDIVVGREQAPYEFMSPYPASLFKLMVAFHTLRLVDRGAIDLDAGFTFDPAGGCAGAAAGTETTRAWLDAMITASENRAACALVKQLHQLGQVDAMNTELRELGLGTLQLNGSSPMTGGSWQPGQVHMTALDTARLLLLIEGPRGVLWRAPDGRRVTARELSGGSRWLLRRLLAQQGFNDELSTSNWCGRGYPAAGIPQRVARRWIDPQTGTVTVGEKRYGQDVRPCNANAEVRFAHKTGFSYNYASDAGIVRSLPGRPRRRYIIAFLSNLGQRYSDPALAGAARLPCFDPGVCFTERIAQLGKRVDDLIARRGAGQARHGSRRQRSISRSRRGRGA